MNRQTPRLLCYNSIYSIPIERHKISIATKLDKLILGSNFLSAYNVVVGLQSKAQ